MGNIHIENLLAQAGTKKDSLVAQVTARQFRLSSNTLYNLARFVGRQWPTSQYYWKAHI